MTHANSIHIFRALTVLAILGSLANSAATAQEICGLASVQYNLMHSDGFEGQQALNAASAQPSGSEAQPAPNAKAQTSPVSALGTPLGYAPKIAKGVAPTITIVSPSNAATLLGRTFEIRGTFTGPVNTGVSINGSPARTFGNQWVATPIRPPSGPFTISAIATAYDGATATATRNVSVGNTVPKLEWLLKQPGNIAPAKIGFSLRIVGVDRKSTRLNSSHSTLSRMPSSA